MSEIDKFLITESQKKYPTLQESWNGKKAHEPIQSDKSKKMFGIIKATGCTIHQ